MLIFKPQLRLLCSESCSIVNAIGFDTADKMLSIVDKLKCKVNCLTLTRQCKQVLHNFCFTNIFDKYTEPEVWRWMLYLYRNCLSGSKMSVISIFWKLLILYFLQLQLIFLSSCVFDGLKTTGLHFVFLTVSLALQKLCNLIKSHLLIFDLRAWAIGVLFRKFSPEPMCSKVFPTFSFNSFSVSCLMWRYLFHFHLIFEQGDKKGSIFILLHAECQLDQHHLLNRLAFFHWMLTAPLSKIRLPYFWIFYSIPLIHVPISVPVPCSF